MLLLIPPHNLIALTVAAQGTFYAFVGISSYYLVLIIIEMVRITRRKGEQS